MTKYFLKYFVLAFFLSSTSAMAQFGGGGTGGGFSGGGFSGGGFSGGGFSGGGFSGGGFSGSGPGGSGTVGPGNGVGIPGFTSGTNESLSHPSHKFPGQADNIFNQLDGVGVSLNVDHAVGTFLEKIQPLDVVTSPSTIDQIRARDERDPARITLEAWEQQKPGTRIPPSFEYLLTESYKLPVDDEDDKPNLVPNYPLPPFCPGCQEVEPSTASNTLAVEYNLRHVDPSNSVSPEAIISTSTALGISTQSIEGCASAVKDLRTPVGGGANRIDDFESVCLLAHDYRAGKMLSPGERANVASCFDAYVRFDRYCVATEPTKYDLDLMPWIGILVRVHLGKPDKILCSALRISEERIVTARHCLNKKEFQADSSGRIALSEGLAFISQEHSTEALSVTGEISLDGKMKPLEFLSVMPDIEDDVVVLAISKPLVSNGKLPPITVGSFQKGQYLTLIGIQEFVKRAYLLRTRLENRIPPSDAELITSGNWKRIVRIHRSAICRAVASSSGSTLEHYCQSYGGTSGAPIFVIDSSPSIQGGSMLVAVQSRGHSAVEQHRPNNEGVILKGDILSIIKPTRTLTAK